MLLYCVFYVVNLNGIALSIVAKLGVLQIMIIMVPLRELNVCLIKLGLDIVEVSVDPSVAS